MNRSAPTEQRRRLGNWLAPPRFLWFGVILLLAWAALRAAGAMAWDKALVYAFDGAATAFIVSLAPLIRDQGAVAMRRHAAENDANRWIVLVLTGAVVLAILAAIHGELAEARLGSAWAVTMFIVTMALAWTFINLVFMLHYAHAFYERAPAGGDHGGFDFKGTPEPDYWDFLYFAFTAGMSFAASDVDVTRGAIRRVVVAHSLLSFVFNIGVLAFSINVLAGSQGS